MFEQALLVMSICVVKAPHQGKDSNASEEIFRVPSTRINRSICSHLSVVAAPGQHLYCQFCLMGRGSGEGALGGAYVHKISECFLELPTTMLISKFVNTPEDDAKKLTALAANVKSRTV
ncbi:hypothetical protein BTVI_41112 [Pitangus sulphuratus]|nr:hypothetical protein BTVI_41112 [Pitangus sulphuratus]